MCLYLWQVPNSCQIHKKFLSYSTGGKASSSDTMNNDTSRSATSLSNGFSARHGASQQTERIVYLPVPALINAHQSGCALGSWWIRLFNWSPSDSDFSDWSLYVRTLEIWFFSRHIAWSLTTSFWLKWCCSIVGEQLASLPIAIVTHWVKSPAWESGWWRLGCYRLNLEMFTCSLLCCRSCLRQSRCLCSLLTQ